MRSKKTATYLCYLILLGFGLFLSVLGPLLPLISNSFSFSLWQSGFLFFVHFSGFILFVSIGGYFAEKYSKKKVLNSCLLTTSLSFLIFGLTDNIPVAFIALFFIGGSGGVLESLGCALLSDINPENSEYHINKGQAFICIGAALSPVLCYFVTRVYSWRAVYFVLSALFLLMFFFFAANKIEEKAEETKFRLSEIAMLIKDRKFLLVLVTIFLYAGTETGTWGYMSTFFSEKLGLGLSGFLVSVFWIAMALGRLVCGKLVRYFEIGKMIILLSFASFLTVLLSTLSSNAIFAFAVTFLTGFCFSSLYPFIMSMGAKRKNTASAFSAIVACGGLGTVVIPFTVGIIGQFVGSGYAQLSTSVWLILISILYLIFRSGWKKE